MAIKRIIVNLTAAFATAICLSTSLQAAPGPALSVNREKAKQDGFYVLHFPAKGKIGKVGEAEEGADYGDKHTPTKRFAEANGTVRLTKGKGICFIATDFMGLEKPLDVICTLPAEAVTSITLSNNIFNESELVKLLRFTELRRIELTGTDVTDETIAKLATLPRIESIIVDRTRSHGQFLVSLAGKKSIRNLNLGHNDINKRCLEELKKLPNLERLSLNSAHLHDSDLAALAACQKLRYLDISDNNDVSNAGLAQLKSLKKLDMIRLQFTAATAKGLLALEGLPLTWVRLEPKQAKKQELVALKKAFPKLYVDFENLKKELLNDYKAAFQ